MHRLGRMFFHLFNIFYCIYDKRRRIAASINLSAEGIHTAIFQLSFRKTDEKTVLQKLEVIPCMVGKKGDYRPYVTEDEKEREKTFRILSPNRNISRFTRAPESFRSTGTVLFDENGIMAGD